MPHATVRPISAPRSALAFLFVLTVVAALALAGAPGHALPLAEDDVSMTVSSEIVVKEDETYTAKFTMSEHGSTPTLSKSICNKETFDADESDAKDVTVEFKDEGDTRSCILQGTGSVSDSSSSVSHSGDEFTVTTPDFNDQSSSTTFNITQSVTFPGEVTEADGGKVDGTKVSFNDGDSHQVKGKDKAAAGATPSNSQESTGRSSSTPTWAWLLMGAIPAAAIGGGVAVAMSQRKKKQTQFGPYATPAQGYDPNQALFSQPDQPGQP
ncbi:viral protein TPX, partial [Actinomyces naeslundii]|uniref:LppM family (lipo)protein n=1 Tax=Actinomyces naeslundii TaxID=1655 RepID=UPI00097ABDE4